MNERPARSGGLAVVILTHNEEANIAQALDSVVGWADEVWVLDSHSTDRTVEIAEEHGAKVAFKSFVSFPDQRNYALRELPIRSEWVLFVDADEWITPELRRSMDGALAGKPKENGFYIKRRFVWMGRWLKRGYYPTWLLRLLRRSAAQCERRSVNEHFVVEGVTGRLEGDIVHEDRGGLDSWLVKHVGYAEKEARERVREESLRPAGRLLGSQADRKRWVRENIWNRLPLFVRPFLYYFYRYFITGAFLEGYPALTYHFLQALWYPFLIDMHTLRLRREGRSAGRSEAAPDGRKEAAEVGL